MVKPPKEGRVYKHVADRVLEMIRDGTLQAGDRLPPEKELAIRFAVGRGSVREALRSLESMGLLERRARGGTIVKPFSGEGLGEALSIDVPGQPQVVKEILEVRKLLEPSIAWLAALRAEPDEISEMEEILSTHEKEIERGGTGFRNDSAFHYALATSTKNDVILRLINGILDLLHQTREEWVQVKGRPTKALRAHRLILEALRARNPEEARQAMLNHLLEVEQLLETVTIRPLKAQQES